MSQVQPNPFSSLPKEMIEEVVGHLDPVAARNFGLACKDNMHVVHEKRVWDAIFARAGRPLAENPQNELKALCKRKVNALEMRLFGHVLVKEDKMALQGRIVPISPQLRPFMPRPSPFGSFPPNNQAIAFGIMGSPEVQKEVFDVAKLRAFAKKRVEKKLVHIFEGNLQVPTIGPQDYASFKKCLKPKPSPIERLSNFFKNLFHKLFG